MGLLASAIIERVESEMPRHEMHGTSVSEIVILTLATMHIMAWEQSHLTPGEAQRCLELLSEHKER